MSFMTCNKIRTVVKYFFHSTVFFHAWKQTIKQTVFGFTQAVTLELGYYTSLTESRTKIKICQHVVINSTKLYLNIYVVPCCTLQKTIFTNSVCLFCLVQDWLLCVQTAAACCPHDAPLPTVIWNQCSEWQIYFNFFFVYEAPIVKRCKLTLNSTILPHLAPNIIENRSTAILVKFVQFTFLLKIFTFKR